MIASLTGFEETMDADIHYDVYALPIEVKSPTLPRSRDRGSYLAPSGAAGWGHFSGWATYRELAFAVELRCGASALKKLWRRIVDRYRGIKADFLTSLRAATPPPVSEV